MADLKYPESLQYTKEHEWLRMEGDTTGVVGITDFAQDQLGDVVYVELPAVGSRVEAGQIFGTVESVKTVSDLYSPVTGEVIEVNTALEDSPELVNSDPYGQGWMLKVRLADSGQVAGLLDAAAYRALVEQG